MRFNTSAVRSEYVVNIFGITLKPTMSIVMEFCPYQSLKELLYDNTDPLSNELKYRLSIDILKGIHALHSLDPPLVHRDLRSPNIFVFMVLLPNIRFIH